MKITFFCPRWGFEFMQWDLFLERVKLAGYQGVEWYPFGEECNVPAVLQLLEKYDLQLCYVFAVKLPGAEVDFSIYRSLLHMQLQELAQMQTAAVRPIHISVQAGREFFTDVQVDECLAICADVQSKYGIPIYQETHRNKWSYAAHSSYPVLQRHPGLLLAFDVSHWFCVSESFLQDQQPAVELAISRTRHVHARVGHSEGPQVYDPALPAYAEALGQHLRIWDNWVQRMRNQNATVISITPEFGPPPYFVETGGHEDLAEKQWQINFWMKELLHHRYNAATL